MNQRKKEEKERPGCPTIPEGSRAAERRRIMSCNIERQSNRDSDNSKCKLASMYTQKVKLCGLKFSS